MNNGRWLLVEELQNIVLRIFSDNRKNPFENVLQYTCSQEFRNIHRKTPVWGLILINFQAFTPAIFLDRDSKKVFYCEYCEILKNTIF